jgi:hypothetical protein
MNVAEDALQPALRQPAPLAEVRRSAAPYRVPVYLACSLVFLAVNYALGEDLRWDTLNYHLYAGFSAVHDRFVQDYFAAGPQSYFNPYVYEKPLDPCLWRARPTLFCASARAEGGTVGHYG